MALALLPGIILLYFILFMDRNQREPLGLVVKVMLLGALSVVPAALLEYILGLLPVYGGGKWLDALVISFVRVAWVEELCKLGVVMLFAWKSPHFNEENDGIVYVGASAIGFALMENIFYVLSFGMVTGILRAITSMPLHCFSGVLMGYFVGRARLSSQRKTVRNNILKGFFLAYLLHGFYDALLLTRTPAALLVFPMVIGVAVFGIRFIKRGRVLSLSRAAAAPAEIEAVAAGQLWKVIISRTLLGICGLFWGFIIWGLIAFPQDFNIAGHQVLQGAITLTFLPVMIGILFELSYRRNKTLIRERLADAPSGHIDSSRTDSVFAAGTGLPGQEWRIIAARILLTISAIFWALLILGFLAQVEEYADQWLVMLLGGALLSFLPLYIGLLLQKSYSKRKSLFNYLKTTLTGEKVSPEQLAASLSPPGQAWKAVLSRTLLPLCGWFWVLLFYALFYGYMDDLNYTWPEIVAAGLFLSVSPMTVGIVAELSYRKKRNAYWQHLSNESRITTAAYDPAVPAVDDEELHAYCQHLKASRPTEGYGE